MSWDSTTVTRRLAGMPELEELHPELAACLVRRQSSLTSLEHPLIVQAPYIPPLASYVNGLFESLSKRAATLLENGAYSQWLDLHTARFRLSVLVKNAHRVDHGAYWELLATLYRAEAPACDPPDGLWLKALSSDKPLRHRFMTREERRVFADLPPLVKVWRIVPDGRTEAAFAHFVAAETAQRVARNALSAPQPPANDFSLVAATLPKTAIVAAAQVQGHLQLLARPGSATGEQAPGPAA